MPRQLMGLSQSRGSTSTVLPLPVASNASALSKACLAGRYTAWDEVVDGSFRQHDQVVDGSFRQHVQLEGITLVTDKASAMRVIKKLKSLHDRPHAWDTEVSGVALGRSAYAQSPVTHGTVVCATCYCGADVDFGSGPRIFVDNSAAGVLECFKEYFESARYRKVFHNYNFERHALARHGIRLRGVFGDTLRMARLWDTSLSCASWEGLARARKTSFLTQALGSESDIQFTSVKLGGELLSDDPWTTEQGAGPLLLAPQVEEPDEPVDEEESKKDTYTASSYQLKDLARHFGLVDGDCPSFERAFGIHAGAAQAAHDDPHRFPEFARYATQDAELTFKLFERLRDELDSRDWCSSVLQRSAADLMRDPDVLRDLMHRPVGSSSSAQKRTGKTMWQFYSEHLLQVSDCLADMEQLGVAVDLQKLQNISEVAEEDSTQHRSSFLESMGHVRTESGEKLNDDLHLMNIGSSAQVRTLLFGGVQNSLDEEQVWETSRQFRTDGALSEVPDKKALTVKSLGLQPSSRQKDYTETGWPKTARAVLADLAKPNGEVEIQLTKKGFDKGIAASVASGIRSLAEANRVRSLIRNFAIPLMHHSSTTGRIHPSWQPDTTTGRLTCKNPNLQCLPKASQDKYCIRDAFVAPASSCLIIADYSQLELRVLAHMTNCRSMIEKFQAGGDYHSEVAAALFPEVGYAVRAGKVQIGGIGSSSTLPTVKDMFGRERNKAKSVNFAVLYGMGARALAELLGTSQDDALALINRWFVDKPEVRKYMEYVKADARISGRAVSLVGRWRSLPFIAEKDDLQCRAHSERAAINFMIQGSAADIATFAMLRLWKHDRLSELGYRLVLQVHDEYVLEGPADSATEAASIVESLMQHPFEEVRKGFTFKVPLEVDISIGASLASK